MNKRSKIKRSVALILALVMVITLLPGMKAEAATAIKVTNLSGSTKQLTKGSTFTLKTNYSKSKLSFKSSKTAVATVSSTGKITAKAAGTAKITITVKANKKVKKTITVKVVKNAPIEITNVSGSTLTLFKDDTFTLKTNYKANELTFSSPCFDIPVSSAGEISALSYNACEITITLKKDKTISTKIRVEVNGGYMPDNSGCFLPTIDSESGRSSYRVIFKEDDYPDMVFAIDNLESYMTPSSKWTGFIFNDDASLCFENYKSFKNVENVGGFTDEEILNIWKSDSEDFIWGFTNETKVYRTEDEDYIRICFEDNDDRDYRCLTIQNKNTGEIANIVYITPCGKYSAEEVFRIFESVTVGGFTEEDLHK